MEPFEDELFEAVRGLVQFADNRGDPGLEVLEQLVQLLWDYEGFPELRDYLTVCLDQPSG